MRLRGLACILAVLSCPSLCLSDDAGADLRVPWDQLSSQEDAPFLFAGSIMDETRPRWGEYQDALRVHPDMLSCLVPEDRDDPAPDLAQSYYWQGIQGRAAQDVCLFRLGTSLRSPERVEAWMAAQGMWLGPEWALDWRSSRDPTVSGSWRAAQVCERTAMLGWFGCLMQRALDSYFVFSVSFDEESHVVGAFVSGKVW